MKDRPAHTSIKELQQFLGFANYYNRFIRSFASDLGNRAIKGLWKSEVIVLVNPCFSFARLF